MASNSTCTSSSVSAAVAGGSSKAMLVPWGTKSFNRTLFAISASLAWRRISVAFPYLLFVSTLRSASSFCCTHTRHFHRSTRPAFRKASFTTELRKLKRGFLTCDSCETSQRLVSQIPPNASGSPCQISLSMGWTVKQECICDYSHSVTMTLKNAHPGKFGMNTGFEAKWTRGSPPAVLNLPRIFLESLKTWPFNRKPAVYGHLKENLAYMAI